MKSCGMAEGGGSSLDFGVLFCANFLCFPIVLVIKVSFG